MQTKGNRRSTGIVHVDNTCRVQTLTKEQNIFYYDLLEEWYRQTKYPILLNTSFNLKGEAIVETLDVMTQ